MVAIVDDADYPAVSAARWYAHRGARTWYAVRSNNHALLMHRILIDAPRGSEVDHWNGNGLDNRRSNLRLSTKSTNQQNSAKQRRVCRSRFKGVCWSKSAKKWVAYIKLDGRQQHLGCFAEELEAAHAYDSAARRLFGEFARLNFPEAA
jgi:hypothetical protein